MIDTKKIYSKWLDYCQLCVEDMTDCDASSQVAADSKYAIYYGRSWDLVCSVREWEPDLFEEVEDEESYSVVVNPDPVPYESPYERLTDIIQRVAVSMTRIKIEHYCLEAHVRDVGKVTA